MIDRPIRALLLACLAAAAPALAATQVRAQAQPNLTPDEQIAPRQVQTVPAVKPKPRIAPAAVRSIPPAANPAPAPDPAPARERDAGRR